jgi:hypothetical protein
MSFDFEMDMEGCDAFLFAIEVPTFQSNLLPTCTGQIYLLPRDGGGMFRNIGTNLPN